MTSQALSNPDLTILLSSVAHGDRNALADLYEQVHGKIYAFALSRLRDADQAGDVLHDVMLVLWRRAGSFRRNSRALTWIMGIAHHKIVDTMRRDGRWGDEEPDDALADHAPSPYDDAAHRQLKDTVEDAMASLSDAHRQVVHLAFYEDLSYPEIARILEIPEGTVKTRMFHAKKALGRRLGRGLEGGTA